MGLPGDPAAFVVGGGVDAAAFVCCGDEVFVVAVGVAIGGYEQTGADAGQVADGVLGVGDCSTQVVNDAGQSAGAAVVGEGQADAGGCAGGVLFFNLGEQVVPGYFDGVVLVDVAGKKTDYGCACRGDVGQGEGAAVGGGDGDQASLQVIEFAGAVFFGVGEGAVRVLYQDAGFADRGGVCASTHSEFAFPAGFLADDDRSITVDVESFVVVMRPAIAQRAVVAGVAAVTPAQGDREEFADGEIVTAEGLGAGKRTRGGVGDACTHKG